MRGHFTQAVFFYQGNEKATYAARNPPGNSLLLTLNQEWFTGELHGKTDRSWRYVPILCFFFPRPVLSLFYHFLSKSGRDDAFLGGDQTGWGSGYENSRLHL